MKAATVSEVLRRFLPAFLQEAPPLSPTRHRAIRAIRHCRTAALGGEVYACPDCHRHHFAYHSCNHKACPLCGREATAAWVERELGKRVGAPYFMVTFTLPEQARETFFGPNAKEGYDCFFAAASGALREKLAGAKGLEAGVSGFTAVLHTWNQQLGFHPHLHLLVPGAGLDAEGRVVTVKNGNFLLHRPLLQAAFKEHYFRQLQAHDRTIDPATWRRDFGVDIRPFGSGEMAIKYLGAYVARSVIADSRIVGADGHAVTFRWKDRSDHDRVKLMTLSGVEFVRRYLRHVLPRGLRSIRYYGFCHPGAKATRERIALHTGRPFYLGEPLPASNPAPRPPYLCGHCQKPMTHLGRLLPCGRITTIPRAPPSLPAAA